MAMPNNPPKILVAALEWGLGHAARCVPVIQELQRQGAVVWIGSSGRALALLRAEFPKLPFVELPAYDVHYPNKNMAWGLGKQGFKILRAIVREHLVLQQFVKQEGVHAVISDCRFGCFTSHARCIFITHQLHIRTPYMWLSAFVNVINRWFIRRYDGLWIPDFAEATGLSLAGMLAHPPLANGKYIGVLSRMQPLAVPLQYDIVAVLSGPEPQRSLLETKILEQATKTNIRLLVVQGKAELLAGQPTEVGDHRAFYPVSVLPDAALSGGQPTEVGDHVPALAAAPLNAVMSAARVILSRSGYSTLMDLTCLGKPAILIPTPGQTEQEYLADYWSKKGAFSVWTQENFDLEKAWAAAQELPGIDPALFPENGLVEVVAELMGSLSV